MLPFSYEFNPTQEEIKAGCQGKLHPRAIEGIELFNRGEYWLAHEALETAWLEERGTIRALYKGILQIGVMYLHIKRRNFRGAAKMYHRSLVWLDPWPEYCRGVNVGQLREDAKMIYQEVIRLGEIGIQEFDDNMLKPIKWGKY
jgi:predicted metal-dependent hydrolase